MNSHRFHHLSCVVFVLSVCGVLRAQDAPRNDWIVLFDGHDLNAWQVSPTAKWIVQDGAIALSDRTDGTMRNEDYLWTKETFGDFILELEFKIGEERCNSGLFLRTADLSDPVYTGIEMQVASSHGQAPAAAVPPGPSTIAARQPRTRIVPPGSGISAV